MSGEPASRAMQDSCQRHVSEPDIRKKRATTPMEWACRPCVRRRVYRRISKLYRCLGRGTIPGRASEWPPRYGHAERHATLCAGRRVTMRTMYGMRHERTCAERTDPGCVENMACGTTIAGRGCDAVTHGRATRDVVGCEPTTRRRELHDDMKCATVGCDRPRQPTGRICNRCKRDAARANNPDAYYEGKRRRNQRWRDKLKAQFEAAKSRVE